jgi:hypothetical protein
MFLLVFYWLNIQLIHTFITHALYTKGAEGIQVPRYFSETPPFSINDLDKNNTEDVIGNPIAVYLRCEHFLIL